LAGNIVIAAALTDSISGSLAFVLQGLGISQDVDGCFPFNFPQGGHGVIGMAVENVVQAVPRIIQGRASDMTLGDKAAFKAMAAGTHGAIVSAAARSIAARIAGTGIDCGIHIDLPEADEVRQIVQIAVLQDRAITMGLLRIIAMICSGSTPIMARMPLIPVA
jgi:hypothetical protein